MSAAMGEGNELSFETAIEMIRSRNALTFEEAYAVLSECASQHVERLTELMQVENDPFTKGKFIELLGDTGDERVIPILRAELSHPDVQVRQWSVLALEELGYQEATAIAAAYRRSHPEEL